MTAFAHISSSATSNAFAPTPSSGSLWSASATRIACFGPAYASKTFAAYFGGTTLSLPARMKIAGAVLRWPLARLSSSDGIDSATGVASSQTFHQPWRLRIMSRSGGGLVRITPATGRFAATCSAAVEPRLWPIRKIGLPLAFAASASYAASAAGGIDLSDARPGLPP